MTTASITCVVADLYYSSSLAEPVINDFVLHPPSGGPLTLPACFAAASQSAINLNLDWSRRDTVADMANQNITVSENLLMGALDRVLAAPKSGTTIALLLANRFDKALDQYGVMFDANAGDGVAGTRQGCAIFLKAIAEAFPGGTAAVNSPAFAEFVSYTAVHELGHALNLWHADGSFMQPSPDLLSPQPYCFADSQPNFLALAGDAGTAPYVVPGAGAHVFGDRPGGFQSGEPVNPFEGPAPRARDPRVTIHLSHERFWPFEPVQIDLEIALDRRSRAKSCTIPDEIDPSHRRFQVWITKPDGERFRLRSPLRFCRPNGTRRISVDGTFRRDMAIFAQPGGHTFTVPGIYRVEATFQLPGGQVLKSNPVECEVLTAKPRSASWQMGWELLRPEKMRRFLRYREPPLPPTAYRRLVHFAEKHASKETAASIHYAIGRSLRRVADATSDPQLQAHRRRQADQHLRSAQKTKGLGPHRDARAHLLLEH